MNDNLKTIHFIENANKVHFNKYDYSNVVYKNRNTKVKIICPIHGEFWQLPYLHSSGHGCPKCGRTIVENSRKLNTETFIKKCKLLHGDLYDYSKVNYIKSNIKVCIICREHGEFWQTPSSHLSGRGCPICRYVKSSSKVRMSKEDFIKRSTKVHNGKYNYENVIYKNTDTKVSIICPIHGEFLQTPHHHLKGVGCPECGSNTYDTEEFIRKARKRHGDKYDYSKTFYKGKKHKVVITCPIHGDFEQLPQNHIKKTGCPECGLRFGVQEKKVFESLKNKFSSVHYQYTNDTFLKGKSKNMSLDCFIPEYNIGIEYQGAHHFYPIEAFGGKKAFDTVHKRDERKYEKCKENGVEVFYISFERKVPDEYFATIYRNTDDLIDAIENYIKNKPQN